MMKIYRLLFMGVALIIPLIAHNARAEDCPEDDVTTHCSTMRMEVKREQADKQLHTLYNQILKRLSLPQEEYLDTPNLKAKFIEAQKKWGRFRDSECAAWYIINQAGTARAYDELECLEKRTRDRIEQLKEWQAALPDPTTS